MVSDRELMRRKPWYRCHRCGEVSKTYAAAQRHADATRHSRIECVPKGTES